MTRADYSIDNEIEVALEAAIDSEPNLPDSDLIFRGEVENDEFDTPSITIDVGDDDREPLGRDRERTNPLPATNEVEVFFREARVTVPVRLIVYTGSKTEREDMIEDLRGLFFPDPPDKVSDQPPEGLQTTLPGHYDTECRIFGRNWSKTDEGIADEGLYRLDFSLEAEAIELSKQTYDQAAFDHNVSAEV